jgi:hypothetical protein
LWFYLSAAMLPLPREIARPPLAGVVEGATNLRPHHGTPANLLVSQPAERIFGGDILWASSVDGDLVVLHVRTSTYLRLDPSAARIFRLLESEGDPERAAVALADQFGLPMDRAAGDVRHVIDSVRGLSAGRKAVGRRPTVKGSAGVLRAWWRLPPRLAFETAKATLVVIAAEVGLRAMDLKTLSKLMQVPLSPGARERPPAGRDRLELLSTREQRLVWAAGWALARWVHDPTCLRQALVLGFFLRRRHPTMHLGMIDGSVAHAWVEAGDFVYNADPVQNAFLASTI